MGRRRHGCWVTVASSAAHIRMWPRNTDPPADPYLAPYAPHIAARCACLCRACTVHVVTPCTHRVALFESRLAQFEACEGGFDAFTRSYQTHGLNEGADGSVVFTEWCPGAHALSLVGDFSACHAQFTTHVLNHCLLCRRLGPHRTSLHAQRVRRVVGDCASQGWPACH